MHAIAFETSTAVGRFVPGRMDVTCFVGYVPRRPDCSISASVRDWWQQQGWIASAKAGVEKKDDALPFPLESWEDYIALFGERRNDRRAQIRSHALMDPIVLANSDMELQVQVDHHLRGSADSSTIVTLTPDLDAHTISLDALVDQLNEQLHGATAGIEMSGSDPRLVIQRTDDVNAGELTVYANGSLGFTEAQQDDVFALPNAMSVAVRSFFQQGGRKCYVIPLGDPLPMLVSGQQRIRRVFSLIWGHKATARIMDDAWFVRDDMLKVPLPMIEQAVTPSTRSAPLTLLLTLADVTYISLPDLVDLLGRFDSKDPGAPPGQAKESFIECSENDVARPRFYTQEYLAPVLSEQDYKIWKRLVFRILEFLTLHAPTVQLVTSLPLPDTSVRQPFEAFVTHKLLQYDEGDAVYYRRLQLAYPWLKTTDSQGLPQQLAAPEGALLGLLARNALVQGAYRSIAGSIHDTAYDVFPRGPYLDSIAGDDAPTFLERVNSFDLAPNGITLLSDVTADLSPYHRFAVVRRIMMLVQRAAYQLGLNHVFESSGSRLWRIIESGLSSLLMNIYQHNGLRGKTSADAFSVTCDRSTMTQADIDNGRLIARIEFRPAVPVEKITVALAINSDGNVGLGSND